MATQNAARQNSRPAPSRKAPVVFIPSIIVPGANDTWIVKPGKAQILEDEISIAQASKILGLSQRRIITICDEGLLLKPGLDWTQPNGPRGKYFLRRDAVWALKNSEISEPKEALHAKTSPLPR